MKLPTLPQGSVIIFLTVIALALFFILSTMAQTVIVQNQIGASELICGWKEIKDRILMADSMGTPLSLEDLEIGSYSQLLRTTTERKEYRALRRIDSSLNLTMTSILLQWSIIRQQIVVIISEHATGVPELLVKYMTSPQVNFFEKNLANFRSYILSYSERQRALFSLQYLFVAAVIILILLLLVGNAFSSREKQLLDRNIRTLTQSLIQILEGERKKIAYDLHDEVIQELASLKMESEAIGEEAEEIAPPLADRMRTLSDRLQAVIKQTRDISLNLRPHDLDHLGLVGGIRALCSDFSRQYGITVQFSATGMDAIKYDFTIAINLYRIVQESLNNTKKHSGASEVSVTLLGASPDIILRIRDNGSGFSPSSILYKPGRGPYQIGITGIRERVRLLSGTFKIVSKEGSGTEIRITVPALEEVAL
jgi:signal transduction histidine kinase